MHKQVRIQHSCLKVVELHYLKPQGVRSEGQKTRDLWDMLRGRETRISCLNKNGELQIQWKTLTQGNKVGSVRDKVQCPPLATACTRVCVCTCKHTSIRIKRGRKERGEAGVKEGRGWERGEIGVLVKVYPLILFALITLLRDHEKPLAAPMGLKFILWPQKDTKDYFWIIGNKAHQCTQWTLVRLLINPRLNPLL